jgi:N-acetylmuramoyl-L-alanine amidase
MKKIILIDPGHGGKDPGAVANGLHEAEINLTVAGFLIIALREAGVTALLTRSRDTDMSLRRRADLERALRPVLFVSLHCNAAASPAARGIEIFTSPGQTKADAAATAILDSIREAFPSANYRTDLADGDPDKEERFFVLTMTLCPAVLLEMGFLTNKADADWLAQRVNQMQMANAIARGILAWKETHPWI